MKNLIYNYQTVISEPYIDIICLRRNYKATILNENSEEILNPQDKFAFVSEAITKLIDRQVVYREFSDINEELINKQATALKAQSDSRIFSKIEQVRTVDTEIVDAPKP